MRHFAGFLLGIVLLPAFFALNWLVSYTAANDASDQTRLSLLALLGAYAALGVVAGVCLAWRSLSPMALLVGGLLLIAAEVLLVLPRLAGTQVNIPQLYDHPDITRGYLPLAVGFALLFGSFLPTRWHRPMRREDLEEMDVRGRELFDDRDDNAATRPGRYDGSWGSGRNDYADEPEQPYGRTGSDQTAVHERPAPGYDQPSAQRSEDMAPAYDYQNQYDKPAATESTRRID